MRRREGRQTVENVFKGHVSVHPKSIGNRSDTIWSECAYNTTSREEWQNIHIRTFCVYIRYLFNLRYDDCRFKCIPQRTFPAAPPKSGGSWATTLMVCASCVFPVRYSP